MRRVLQHYKVLTRMVGSRRSKRRNPVFMVKLAILGRVLSYEHTLCFRLPCRNGRTGEYLSVPSFRIALKLLHTVLRTSRPLSKNSFSFSGIRRTRSANTQSKCREMLLVLTRQLP
ncbi:hypothetical protein RvY_07868 [Ramazzottius varieornatus]|uniref:Uncharacterized protein n=1 Tax=Ramazzottius varieornatus TaxID=947166 RepID=A0A1D1V3S6_RAMVA|nr:hypothetical protein RvY_07868 [Ramazzottius varieornatus]